MSSYRCVFINHRNQIVRYEMGDASDDETAVRWMLDLVTANTHFPVIELWRDGDVIHRETHRDAGEVSGLR